MMFIVLWLLVADSGWSGAWLGAALGATRMNNLGIVRAEWTTGRDEPEVTNRSERVPVPAWDSTDQTGTQLKGGAAAPCPACMAPVAPLFTPYRPTRTRQDLPCTSPGRTPNPELEQASGGGASGSRMDRANQTPGQQCG